MDLLLVLKLPVYLVDEVFAELTSDPLYQKDREVVEFVTGHADTVHVVDTLVGRGSAAPSADPAVRAAFLLVNDLALLLLRNQIAAAIGLDPLTRQGLDRWAREITPIYVAS